MTETEADIAASGYREERQLFDGDTGTFPLQLRQTIVRLLRGPYIDGVADPRLWTTVLDNRQVIADYLCEIFLVLSVDPDRKIAMLTPAEVDAPHTTAIQPRKPLRREETLLALRLRLLLDRHAGSGTDATISRAAAREILEEHRQPGTVDDKRLEELTDASISRLLALKLLLPTELAGVYRVSNALAMALPFDSIDQIPAYIEALARSDAQELLDPEALDPEALDPELPDLEAPDPEVLDPEVPDPELPGPDAEGHASGSTVPNNTTANEEEL